MARLLLLTAPILAAVRAAADEVSPVEKVLTMLEDLQTQVIMEGKLEAKTYDKFACFCKDLSTQKSDDITEAQDAATDLEASIETLSRDRDDLTDTVAELVAKIQTLSLEMEDATKKREKEHATFLKNEADLDLGVKELEQARDEIKAKSGAFGSAASFIQSAQSVLEKAAEIGGGFLPKQKHNRLLSALLEDGSGSTSAGGTDIVETIEDILENFKQNLEEVRDKETKADKEYKELMDTKSSEKADAEDDVVKSKKRIGEKSEKIATSSTDLTSTKAVMADDKAYLTDLTQKCNAKSAEWDQRSSMRADEITAITTAVHIIKGKVAEKTTEKTVRLIQMPKATKAAALDVESADDEEIDEILDNEPMFLQLSRPREKLAALQAERQTLQEAPRLQRFLSAHSNPQEDKRDRAIAMLRSKASELKSVTLAALVTQAASDPFVKIRKLIQELVERLLQEAADEANHKGWCDKELGKANQKRDQQASDIRQLNEDMAANEAKRDKLSEEMAKLTVEIDELKAVLGKTTKERADEKAENEATIAEAKEGKEAVDEAIDVLSKFYKTAAKAELVQTAAHTTGVDEDMPDAGFSGSYTGSQGASTGIIGMMEVIQSDFVRTMSETEKQERQAAAEFLEFETATKVSIGTKKVGLKEREQDHSETVDALGEETDSLNEEQALLDKALQELTELQPACVDTGMTYEEKVAKREQEIESLKTALCVLDNEGPVQTEPGCEDF